MRMVEFKNFNNVFGGILLDDDNIICGCCGGLFKKDDPNVEIIEELEWIDISNEILGE